MLLELRERAADEDDDDDDDDDDDAAELSAEGDDEVGYVARIYATACAGAGDGRARRGGRHRRSPAVPAL